VSRRKMKASSTQNTLTSKTRSKTSQSVGQSFSTERLADERLKGLSMNFEHNGQNYFLNFLPSEGQWFLYAATEMGIQKVPVCSDMYVERFVMPLTDEEPKVM
jgi:hypothetical protein